MLNALVLSAATNQQQSSNEFTDVSLAHQSKLLFTFRSGLRIAFGENSEKAKHIDDTAARLLNENTRQGLESSNLLLCEFN